MSNDLFYSIDPEYPVHITTSCEAAWGLPKQPPTVVSGPGGAVMWEQGEITMCDECTARAYDQNAIQAHWRKGVSK